MVSKDQAIGGAILIVCTVVAIVYLVALFGYEQLIKPWFNVGSAVTVQYWLIALPVLIAFVTILFIGAWIGWTMATTPPPKPIEEITTEIEDKKEAEQTVSAPEETPDIEEKPAIKKKK